MLAEFSRAALGNTNLFAHSSGSYRSEIQVSESVVSAVAALRGL